MKYEIYNKKKTKPVVATALKKTCLIEQFCRFVLSVRCNKERNLMVTVHFPLAKVPLTKPVVIMALTISSSWSHLWDVWQVFMEYC